VYILCELVFRRYIPPSSSGQKNPRARNQCEQVTSADFSTLKMEATRSSETSVHCHVNKSLSLVSILSQTNPAHITQSYFSKINFDVIIFWEMIIIIVTAVETSNLTILMLSSNLCLGLPYGLFTSRFPRKTLYAFHFSPSML
jgi:hypothetical protein